MPTSEALYGVVVTGTDTGVGKSTIACALLRVLRAGGSSLTPWKPVETGDETPEATDASRLARAAGDIDPWEVCAHRLPLPASPRRAARAAGVSLRLAEILAHGRALASSRGRPLLVEGAGGLLVPFTEGETFADLAVALGWPCLVVARDALGTVNHTLLTVEALQRRDLAVLGVVLNAAADTDARSLENADELRRSLGAVPVFGPLPRGDEGTLDAAVQHCGLDRAVRSALGA